MGICIGFKINGRELTSEAFPFVNTIFQIILHTFNGLLSFSS